MNIFVTLPTPAGNGPGAAVDMTAFGSVKTITVADMVGTLVQIEISNDPGATVWTPIGTFQTIGEKTFEIACHWMRAVVSNFKGGGAPKVEVGGTNDGTLFASLMVLATNGTGAPTDVTALGVFKTVQVSGPFSGIISIEVSEDGGVTWALAFSFTGGAQQTKTIAASWMRVTRSGVGPLAVPLVNVAAVVPGGGGGTGASKSAVLAFGTDNLGCAAGTRFLDQWVGEGLADSVEVDPIVMPRDGILKSLVVRHCVAAGNGNPVIYTVRVNGVDTALTVTVPTGVVSQVFDLVHTVPVLRGDQVTLKAFKPNSILFGLVLPTVSMELV